MDWKKNRLAIGAVVLVVLVGLTVWAMRARDAEYAPPAEDETASEAASLPEIDEDEVTALEIDRPEEDPVRLEKRGDTWWVTAPLEAEADQSTVSTALDKLSELEVTRVAATNADNHERLEVAESNGIHVIAKDGDTVLADLWIGSYGGGATMVRPEGQDDVLAVDGSIKFAFNKAVKDWRNRRVVDVRPTDVKAVSFENDSGAWQFVRNDDDEWTQAEGQEPIEDFNAAKVQSIVASLARMRAVDFAAPDVTPEQAGLGEGAAKVVLTVGQTEQAAERQAAEESAEDQGAETAEEGSEATEEGAEAEGTNDDTEGEAEQTPVEPQVIILSLGGEESDGQFYLQREGNDTIYVVSRFLADKIRIDTDAVSGESAPPPSAQGGPGGAPGMPPGMPGMPGGPHGGMPGGPGGPGGGQKIPPEVMRQIQEQLRKQGGGAHPAPPPGH